MNRLFFLFALVCATAMQAQNLVPNPSFEEYDTCPTNISQIDYAVGWTSLSGSSDYFNACADDSMGVPSNLAGYQQAATGQAYAGVATFLVGIPYYRENIWTQLTTPMIVGSIYYLSMKASPGGFSSDENDSPRWASSGIGLRLSTIPLAEGLYQDNHPLMSLDQVLQDTAVWTTISSTFVADSAYQYVLIGCFWEDSYLDTVLIDPSADTDGAYAFIDDVCISDQFGVCDIAAGIEDRVVTPKSVAIHEQNGRLIIHVSGSQNLPAELHIMDSAGRVRCNASLVFNDGSIDISSFPSGFYILSATTPSGRLRPVSFVHLTP
jgi:hypothetical protein